MKSRKFIVLGGVGAIGRVVVRDLFESNKANHILIADYNEPAAIAYARTFRSRRVKAASADATKHASLKKVFKGHDVVVNCTQHDFNLRVMKAALAAKVHYVDLGGLFHWTRKQLRLNTAFKKAGLVAILGSGCAPGITNIMARHLADQLDRIDSINIYVGTVDFNPQQVGFCFPYSAQTIIEEMTLTPWVFQQGRFKQIQPHAKWVRVPFPEPVGSLWTLCTRHSEVATIPLSFRSKKIKGCEFFVSFDRAFVRELLKRLRTGWTLKDFMKLPASRAKPNDYEVARVVAFGLKNNKKKRLTMDCHAQANARWHASAGDVDTGCPPSVIAQMIADGTIKQPGVWAPERAVPAEKFFAQLERRKLKLIMTGTL